MILVIGEILMDIFPEYRRIGGAPFNFAFHLMKFGFPVTFVSRIGKDPMGDTILSALKDYQFNTDQIQIDSQFQTGRVIVTPGDGSSHQFNIIPDVAYDHIRLPDGPANFAANEPVKLIYFGTLIQRTRQLHEHLHAFLDKKDSSTKTIYDINLRPDCYTKDVIEKSLEKADILKLNETEVSTLQDMFLNRSEEKVFIEWLKKEFKIEWVSLTRGDNGSDLYTAKNHFTTKGQHFEDIVDTVGAGDAYAAVLAVGYLFNWPAEKLLSVASDFAAGICKINGAIPDDPSFYKPFMDLMET